jgi:hypothetical protein
MKQGIVYAVVAVVIVVGVLMAATPLRHRVRDLAANLKTITADTGDVMAGATYQRFKARRDAIATMHSALLAMTTAESAFVADSGRPTTVFLDRYRFPNDRYNLGPTVEIQRDRWIARIGNTHTTIQCTLTAMLDTVTERYHPGVPVCAEWTAGDSIAINNTPPRVPYIVENSCGGEGCAITGTWAACSTLTARESKEVGAAPVFTIHPGERFTGLKGDLHVDVAGMVGFRHAMVHAPEPGGATIQFTPADTLYLLNSQGEGYWTSYFRGQVGVGYQFWGDASDPEDTAILLRRTQTVLWMRVRNAAGQEGWIVADYFKMATGRRGNWLERCLQ